MKLPSRIRRKIEIEVGRLTAATRYDPSTIIIGAQKAGTSSLADYLAQHPQVGASHKKEIRYFQAHFSRGLSWYRGHFPSKIGNDYDIIFEASPGYILYPHVPARIKAQYPDIKIIALLRDPIHRAYSHYTMNLRRENVGEQLSFADAIDAEEMRLKESVALINDPHIVYSEAYSHFSYLARGRYWEQLQHWYDNFPKEQIMLIQAEELFEQSAEVYAEVLQFLDLSDWQPQEFLARNQSGATQNLRDKIGDDLYNQLRDYFDPYNETLYEKIGRRFDWGQ